MLLTHRFNSRDDLATTLQRYVWLYNEHLPQKALEHVAPVDALETVARLEAGTVRQTGPESPGT